MRNSGVEAALCYYKVVTSNINAEDLRGESLIYACVPLNSQTS